MEKVLGRKHYIARWMFKTTANGAGNVMVRDFTFKRPAKSQR